MSTSKLINFPLTNYLDLQIDNRSSYKNESFWRRSNTTFAPKSSKVKGLMLQYVRSSSRSCLTNNFFPKTRFRASYLAFQSERFWAGEKNSHDRMKTKENKECFLCQTPCDNLCANCQSVYFCSSEHLKLHQVTIVEENQQVSKLRVSFITNDIRSNPNQSQVNAATAINVFLFVIKYGCEVFYPFGKFFSGRQLRHGF